MKLTWLIAIFTFVLSPIIMHAQDDEKEDECWCKNETRDVEYGTITVWNVDLLSAMPGNARYGNVEGCDGDGCDDEDCTFDTWVCRLLWLRIEELTEAEYEKLDDKELEADSVLVKRCGYEPGGEGECTNEEYGVDLPFDTTGTPGDKCDCIEIDDRGGPYIFYNNVNIRLANGADNYDFAGEPQCLYDCEGSTCNFWKFNPRSDKWDYKDGFCSAFWPGGGVRTPLLNTDEEKVTSTIKFYPNPANNFIQIEADENAITEIYNMSGQRIMNSSTTTIDVSSLVSGVYYIVISQDGELLKDKLIID
ncbi:MAG: hypothetical protein ACI8ZM_004130 [Crocinitomix sp.]|jgi:hypothetical protein